MTDTPDMPQTPAPTPQPPAAPAPIIPPIQVNMPRQRSRASKILTTALVIAIIIIAYMGALLAAMTEKPMATATLRDGDTTQQVAVFKIGGIIDSDQSTRFAKFEREVVKDATIKAVVLRIDSPGGSVAPSDQINAAVKRIVKANKKVVVSMGGVAASGGYYISVGGQYLFAEPTTVTGSIGVISQMPVVVGTMDRIGMSVRTIRSTAAEGHKARLNPFEEPTVETIAEHKVLLDKIQEIFTSVVAEGREMLSPEEVRELANGKTWLGAEAVEKKLVDEIGYLDDAIDKAAELAGVVGPKVLEYKTSKGLLARMMSAKAGVTVDTKLLDEIQTPRILLIWRP